MKTHHLNVHYTDFDAIHSGCNPMLIRRDLGFKIGDVIRLTRYFGFGRKDADPSAPVLVAWVSAIKRGGSMGLLPGYVVLNLTDVCEEKVAA